MATSIWVNICSGNGLLPNGTKPFPESILTYHPYGPMAFIWGPFQKRYIYHQSHEFVWKLFIRNLIQILQWPVSYGCPLMDIDTPQECGIWVPCHICCVADVIMYLTHRVQDKMAATFLTTVSNTFLWIKIYKFRLRIHWSSFPMVQLTIFRHWFR